MKNVELEQDSLKENSFVLGMKAICFIEILSCLSTEAVPGSIRQAEHFVAFMRRFVEYVKVCDILNIVDSSVNIFFYFGFH